MRDEVTLTKDQHDPNSWRVERIDDDGGVEITIFAGPRARARCLDFVRHMRPGIKLDPEQSS